MDRKSEKNGREEKESQDDQATSSLSITGSQNQSSPTVGSWTDACIKFLNLNALEDYSEEELLNQSISDLNVSEYNDTNRRNIVSPLHVFNVLVNDVSPLTSENEDKSKVLIIHQKGDTQLAENLSEQLSNHNTYNCRAVTISQIEHILVMRPYDFKKAAIDWAEIIIVIIDESWFDDIENMDTSGKCAQSRLDRKYEFTILQHTYVSKAAMNLKLVPVKKSETIINSQRRIEFGDPLDIRNIDQLAMNVTKLRDAAKRQQDLVLRVENNS